MVVRPDNRLADAPMVPVACRRCGALRDSILDAVRNGELAVVAYP